MSERALGRQFESVQVPAREIQVGDRLGHRTRVHKVHEHGGRILVATKTQGARSGSVQGFDPEEIVTVRRAPA